MKSMENLDFVDAYGLGEIKKASEKKKDSKITLAEEEELSQTFFTSMHQSSSIFVTLAGNELILKSRESEQVLTLGFWTTFHPILKQNKLVGFKIHSNPYQFYELYSEDAQSLEKWKNSLMKRVVMWGFYEDYKPLAKIGKGKSASVFLARRRSDSEKVAIKAFLKEEFNSDPKSLIALQNEVRILRKIEHPNIIKIYGLYETEKSYYMVIEYIQGKTMKDFIESQTVSVAKSKQIITELASALKYLAKKDIAHRDIKPDNILMTKESKPVLVDFGLATECDIRNYIYKHCGTPGFVAPEILESDWDKITPNVDIFSLGIVFHLLVFKKFPYTGRDFSNILEQNRKAEFKFNSRDYVLLSEETKILFQEMLAAKPGCRISAKRLLKKLISKAVEKENEENLKRSTSRQKNSAERDSTTKLVRSGSLGAVMRHRFNKLH